MFDILMMMLLCRSCPPRNCCCHSFVLVLLHCCASPRIWRISLVLVSQSILLLRLLHLLFFGFPHGFQCCAFFILYISPRTAMFVRELLTDICSILNSRINHVFAFLVVCSLVAWDLTDFILTFVCLLWSTVAAISRPTNLHLYEFVHTKWFYPFFSACTTFRLSVWITTSVSSRCKNDIWPFRKPTFLQCFMRLRTWML